MEYMWLGLLAIIVFLMYMWFRPTFIGEPRPSCNTCPGKKNVPGVE